jgi:hypothetical protein
MNKIKILNIVLVIFLIVDVLHFFIYRFNSVKSNLMEGAHEISRTTFIKWGLCLLAIIALLFVKKQKTASYLLVITGIGMIWLFIVDGPLNHILLLYSSVSLWTLGIIGAYLLYLGGKKILTK